MTHLRVIRAQSKPYREKVPVLCLYEGIIRDPRYNSSRRVTDSLMIHVEFEDQIEAQFMREMNSLRFKHQDIRFGRPQEPFPIDIKLIKVVTLKYVQTGGKELF